MYSSPMRWNARTSKQKWEQVNLRNFQGVKVQISGILIPDITLIPSYTYRMLNPNSKIKASRVPCHTYFLTRQGFIISNKHIAHRSIRFTFTITYKKRAIFNRILQFAFKCRLKLLLFNTKKHAHDYRNAYTNSTNRNKQENVTLAEYFVQVNWLISRKKVPLILH